jgi:hypothetical protein
MQASDEAHEDWFMNATDSIDTAMMLLYSRDAI